MILLAASFVLEGGPAGVYKRENSMVDDEILMNVSFGKWACLLAGS